MNRDFKNYNDAKAYKAEMQSQGFKAYIEEFWNFDGAYWTVLVW